MFGEKLAHWFFDRQLLKNGETYDRSLVMVLLMLLSLGLVMIYSADPSKVVLQAKFAVVSVLGAAVFGLLPLYFWKRCYPWILLGTLLVLAITPFFGKSVNGAVRWLSLGPISVQPSEFFKLATIVYMSSFFHNRQADLAHIKNGLKKAWWIMLPIGFGLVCIYFTKDLGSIIVVGVIVASILFIVNISWKVVIPVTALGVLASVALVFFSQFRMDRVKNFIEPWSDAYGVGYQAMGSLTSLNKGGWWGQGLGNGIMKRGYLPESHTDFILAVIGEELGYIGIVVVVLLYLWVIARAFSISKQAKDLSLFFNSFLSFGIGAWLAVQVCINVGVVLSVFPNKGLTLPLMSYGGSSLLMSIASFMLLVRADYENRLKLRDFQVEDPKDRKRMNHESNQYNR